jgi:hypothetical protein
MMSAIKELRISLVLGVAVSFFPGFGIGQTTAPTSASAQQAAAEHDGQHDFDFLFGRWKVHARRLLHPLTGSNQWIEFDGTNTVHRLWVGKANLDEFEADTPSGHVEGMTIRTYDGKSHRWNIYWSSQSNGTIDFPPMVGAFKGGRGEFYDSEKYNGKDIRVRFIWTVADTDSCHWEQAFSQDGGKTWETNFAWDLTRDKSTANSDGSWPIPPIAIK